MTGSGAGEGSLYLVEAGGMRIVIWGRAPAGTSVPAAALARYGRPDVMVLPADMMDEVSTRLRSRHRSRRYLPADTTAQGW